MAPRLLASTGLGLAGQVCTSRARILVPRSRHDEWVEALAAGLAAERVGDPADPETTVGPLATEGQRRRVKEYIRVGTDEGARLVQGGGRPAHLSRGWFVEPTLFDDVTSDMRIAREEIFGPVLSVLSYDDEDEAVRIAKTASTAWPARYGPGTSARVTGSRGASAPGASRSIPPGMRSASRPAASRTRASARPPPGLLSGVSPPKAGGRHRRAFIAEAGAEHGGSKRSRLAGDVREHPPR